MADSVHGQQELGSGGKAGFDETLAEAFNSAENERNREADVDAR